MICKYYFCLTSTSVVICLVGTTSAWIQWNGRLCILFRARFPHSDDVGLNLFVHHYSLRLLSRLQEKCRLLKYLKQKRKFSTVFPILIEYM